MCSALFRPTRSKIRRVKIQYRGSVEFARHAARILPDVRASEADIGICSCIWRIETIFTSCICWTKDEQEDLSNDERRELRALVTEIKATR